jgi:hypothetical protein
MWFVAPAFGLDADLDAGSSRPEIFFLVGPYIPSTSNTRSQAEGREDTTLASEANSDPIPE